MNQGFAVSFLCVVFTLLICVMVMNPPFLCGGFPLELPVTKNPDEFGERRNHPVVHIKYDRTIYFGMNWLPEGKFHSYQREIQDADRIILSADANLNFGIVRIALAELSAYRRQGIVLSSEEQWVEMEPSPFQQYLNQRSICYCGW